MQSNHGDTSKDIMCAQLIATTESVIINLSQKLTATKKSVITNLY